LDYESPFPRAGGLRQKKKKILLKKDEDMVEVSPTLSDNPI